MKHVIAAAAFLAAATGAASAQDPVWDGNTVVLEAQELAPGVFAVVPEGAAGMAAEGAPIATTGGFVIGEHAVLVVESMLNERLNRQFFDLIAARTDRPVRYLVNTSFHGDHSYGNAFVPEEVSIIQHEATAAYIGEHFEADRAFMIQNFGAGRGIEEVAPVTADLLVGAGGHLAVDLGGIAVEIRDFGFAQTGGDLFVSVPAAKVLWTGNAVVAEKPALPWLLDGHLVETLETLRSVHAAFDADTRVVPGHGPVTGMEAIHWHVDYLGAVRDGVQAAVDEGLSLEETVARVTLPDYGGYALFGWVHPGLNVPAAYNDLK
ncbi:MBL fold metallo-hydrolase [Defluviimonas sp. WL0024]|uniref:MBL fold metallo-hydrolase n=1 Tax=Albidovulum salinarum TaxID=2984153 RepID=A0ABT2X5C5_9RHOB|nr:MBL fold metallo-hydrolase [Defluviimonas sp. WL0024]MCU9848212.1 MBL fold metallo-hydrolase [Defluviimonas sp. WL0024]